MKTVEKGIRLKPNGKFLVTKSINGKRHYKETNTKKEAIRWKNEFKPNSIFKTDSPTLRDMYEHFKSKYFGKLEELTQYKKTLRMGKFIEPLLSVKLIDLSPDLISEYLANIKLLASEARYNYDKELKDLAGMFHWHKKNVDPEFVTPLREYHYQEGKIRDIEKKEKDISPEDFDRFIDNLGDLRDLAILQFYLAARIGEVAGLMPQNIDFVNKSVKIKDVITWIKGKPVPKSSTKTGKVTYVRINGEMERILKRRISLMHKNCPYIFHLRGRPLRYERIRRQYNKALKDAGLDYTATHILRYGMATLGREYGGVEYAQAAGRWETAKMAEQYGKLNATEKNSEVVIYAEKLFRKIRASKLRPEEKKDCKLKKLEA